MLILAPVFHASPMAVSREQFHFSFESESVFKRLAQRELLDESAIIYAAKDSKNVWQKNLLSTVAKKMKLSG